MSIETEICIYAKIGDFSGLMNPLESHAQCNLRNDKGSVRVRKITRGGNSTYETTVKKKLKDSVSAKNIEINRPCDEEYYENFRSICVDEMVKDRFIFPLRKLSLLVDGQEDEIDLNAYRGSIDIQYEVDVFPKEGGGYHEWCKIDLELDALIPILTKVIGDKDIKLNLKISHLPFKPKEAILSNTTDQSQKAIIDKMRDTVMTRVIKDA